MGGVDDGVHVVVAQPPGEPRDTAEPADPHVAFGQERHRNRTRERRGERELRPRTRRGREPSCLGRTPEEQDVQRRRSR
jgi:hypothetical protein